MTIALVGAQNASADVPLPPEIVTLVGTPDGHAEGSNDWTCTPSPEHPDPVVLVHGTSQNRQNDWSTLSPVLKAEGYCIFALTYGNFPDLPWPLNAVGGLGSMEDSARQLASFVDDVLASTGADKVDLVGHSQGTLMPAKYVREQGGNTKVDKYISMAPMWAGSHRPPYEQIIQVADRTGQRDMFEQVVRTAGCGSCPELIAGSSWYESFGADGPYADGVEYTNIVTVHDNVVVPYTSGIREAPNAENIVLQDRCPLDLVEHEDIVDDPIAGVHVLNALDPSHPRQVPCFPVPAELD
ncbi:esterase/lipase family protein [Rhodococcus sp. NPDC058521]|uniref:esterase/lipase family protein n=1 Tax=Rhodococcus sp. NPDC058521 TaxID=3346536 RepID=UPI003667C674